MSKIPTLIEGDAFVSPDGSYYPCDGDHAEWARTHMSYMLGVEPPEDLDDGSGKNDPVWPFLERGWIRVCEEGGVEMDKLTRENAPLVREILTAMVHSINRDENAALYVQSNTSPATRLGHTITVPISPFGHLDFTEFDVETKPSRRRYSRKL